MIGIYKIENLINHKIYIGQSVHIERRWTEHCLPSTTSVISSAIKEYGKDNFSFEVIKECDIEQLDELEEYYIHFYNSIVPNGYNVEEKINGKSTLFNYYGPDMLQNIFKDLEECTLTLREISQKYDLNVSTISRINAGKIHIDQARTYPIRKCSHNKSGIEKEDVVEGDKTVKRIFEKRCCDCGIQISSDATRCISCENKRRITKKPVTRDELKILIRTTSFCEIGRKFNISDNAVRKWCKRYDLPTKKSEINKISQEDWDKI